MKKSLAFLTGICLALSSGLASAVTLNGWNVGNPTPVGAAGLVIASKSVGDVAKTSKALITPNASQVSKILRGGVAGVALTVAVNELLDGIDWVMDPANNQIRYYEPNTGGDWLYFTNGFNHKGETYRFEGYTAEIVARQYYSYVCASGWNTDYCNPKSFICTLDTCPKIIAFDGYIRQFTPSKIASTKLPEEKTLPLDTASQKVIDKAEAGNTDAQIATVAAAQDILNEAENDAEKAKPIVQQLEANAILAGSALHPNKISHDREEEIREMKPNDPCDEISQAIKDLEETVKWRKSDLNAKDKGSKDYVGHQKRIRILRDKKDDLNRAYKIWCEGN